MNLLRDAQALVRSVRENGLRLTALAFVGGLLEGSALCWLVVAAIIGILLGLLTADWAFVHV